jgi:hypothetical protein
MTMVPASMSGLGYSGNKIPSGYRAGQIQNFDPQQMELFKSLFSNVGPQSFLSQLSQGNPETFNQIEAPALRQFNELQGNLASRFSGMGQGGRQSSGFQNATTSAASNFAENLQAQRANLQRQALHDLMSMSNQLLSQRPYEQFLVKKQQRPSGLGGALGALGGGALGFFTGGPAGALTGASAGYGIGSGRGLGDTDLSSMYNPSKDWAYEFANYFDPRI